MPVAEEPGIVVEEIAVLGSSEKHQKSAGVFHRAIKPWLKTLVIAAAIFFFTINFLAQGFSIVGSCMEPNLGTGERVLGNKLVYRFSEPSRGDVIVFRYPNDPGKMFIKRVIATPGEIIRIDGGQVFINGVPLAEPYLGRMPHGTYGPERVKPGCLFVMGDYRDQSNDSRFWGELPIENVTAKVWIRYWPMKHAGAVR